MFNNLPMKTLCLALLMSLAITAHALPPEIEADRLLIAAKQALAVENYAEAKGYFEKVLALKVPIADEFHIHYAKILTQTGNHTGAYKQFENYLNKAGREGKFYMEALEGMTAAEKDIERVRQQNRAAMQKLVSEGDALKEKNKCKEAIVKYSGALLLSVDPEVLNKRGVCYDHWSLKPKEYDKAIDDYTRAITINPDKAYFYLNRGNSWYGKKEYAKAAQDYTETIKRDQSITTAYNKRGQSLHNLGQYDKAIADYSKFLEQTPNDIYAYVNRAICWENKGELDKAIADRDFAILKDTSKYVPTKAKNYEKRGNLWKKKGDRDKAIADYTTAIQLTPQNHSPLFERGRTLYDQDKIDEAIADYTKVIEIKPTYSSAYYNRGLCWWSKKDYDKSIVDFTDAIKHNPKDSWAHYFVGRNRSAKKEWGKAIINYTEAIALDAKHYWAHSFRGLAFKETGNLNAAIDDFTKMIELKPKDTFGYEDRAAIRIDKGEIDLAMADFYAIIKTLTNSRGRLFSRMASKLEKNNYDAAITLWDKVIERFPSATNYRYRADAKLRAGNRIGGIDDFTKGIELEPEEYRGYTSRARALRKLGEQAKALADYDQALKLLKSSKSSPLGTLSAKASLLLDMGRSEEAQQAYKLTLQENDRQIGVSKENSRYYSNGKYVTSKAYYTERKARFRKDFKDYPGAITDFTSVIAINPDAAYYKQRADILWSKTGEYKLAEQDFTKMLEMEPDNEAALAGPGIIYYRQGKYRKARKTLLKAVALKPESVAINNALALFYASCPKKSYRDSLKAIEHAKLAFESTKNKNHHAYEILAFAHAAGEQFAEAVMAQNKAVSLYQQRDPWNVNAEQRYLSKMQERLVSYENKLLWEGEGHPLEWLPAKAELI